MHATLMDMILIPGGLHYNGLITLFTMMVPSFKEDSLWGENTYVGCRYYGDQKFKSDRFTLFV